MLKPFTTERLGGGPGLARGSRSELLPLPYFHGVFTLPAAIDDLAWHNKAVVYDLLFKAAAETLLTPAADPKHLSARIGFTAVLHSWARPCRTIRMCT